MHEQHAALLGLSFFKEQGLVQGLRCCPCFRPGAFSCSTLSGVQGGFDPSDQLSCAVVFFGDALLMTNMDCVT